MVDLRPGTSALSRPPLQNALKTTETQYPPRTPPCITSQARPFVRPSTNPSYRTLKNYRDPVFVAPRIMGKLVTCEGGGQGEKKREAEKGGREGREHLARIMGKLVTSCEGGRENINERQRRGGRRDGSTLPAS